MALAQKATSGFRLFSRDLLACFEWLQQETQIEFVEIWNCTRRRFVKQVIGFCFLKKLELLGRGGEIAGREITHDMPRRRKTTQETALDARSHGPIATSDYGGYRIGHRTARERFMG